MRSPWVSLKIVTIHVDGISAPPAGHVVAFYEDDQMLVDNVSDFAVRGLEAGDVVMIVATATHRDGIGQRLMTEGIDVAALSVAGRYVELDAHELLERFLLDGSPDPDRFAAEVGGRIREATKDGRPIRIFGEMVAILWHDGRVPAAIELEALWNDLTASHDFFLFCAYPIAAVASPEHLRQVKEVCDRHTSILTPTSYTTLASLTPVPDEVDRSRFFLPVPLAARAVRAFVAETLTTWGAQHLVNGAVVVVTELVSNAIRHASSPFRFTISQRGDAVRFSVHDAGPGVPSPRTASADSPDGRGVALIAALSQDWGTDVVRDGKVVWAELGPVNCPSS